MKRDRASGRTPAPVERSGKVRRPKLSKESIITAALELLRKDPGESVTFERVAAAMGVSAMSLYVHVGPREGLIDAVVDHLLSSFRVDLDRSERWQVQLQRCIEAVFALIRQVPAPMTLLARARSGGLVGWASLTTPMLEILRENADLRGPELALAASWLIRSVISMSVLEAAFPTPTIFYNVAASLDRIPEQQRRILMPILPFMALEDGGNLPRASFLARRILDGLEGYIAEVRSRAPETARAEGRRASDAAVADGAAQATAPKKPRKPRKRKPTVARRRTTGRKP